MDLGFDSVSVRGLRGYLRRVAEACGSGMDSSFVEPGPPVYAYVAVDGRLPRFPTRDVALWWHEEHGWAAGIETHAGEDLILLTYLGTDVLPEPHIVARFLTELRAERFPGQPRPPALRRAGDGDDLPQRLAGYAEPVWAMEPW